MVTGQSYSGNQADTYIAGPRPDLQYLFMRALIGGALAGLLDTGLGRQNGDAEILTYFDVVRILQRRIEFMNLLQKFRSAGSELFCANTHQGLAGSHADRTRRAG